MLDPHQMATQVEDALGKEEAADVVLVVRMELI